MPTPINNNNQQPRQRVPITVDGYPEKVKDLLRTKYPDYDQVMGGGQQQIMNGSPSGNVPPVATMPQQNFFQNNQVLGKFEKPVVNSSVQPVQTGTAPTTDFTQMQQPQQFTPQGTQTANPSMGPVAQPPLENAGTENVTNFEQMPVSQQATGWASDGTAKYDSLSAALNGSSPTASQPQQAAQFHSDPSQRDGGFFGWLKGLMPKKRPGKREGETDDEYDRRRTRNVEMMATFADAIRHMGNIVNTAKGAPLQQFNDPTSMIEQGYQNRKAQRQKQAALDADAAYKQANLTLKERAADADRAYKQLSLNLKQQAADRAAKNDEFNINFKKAGLQRQLDNDKFNHDLAGKKFDETKRHNQVAEGQSAARIALAQERNGIARARLAHSIASGGSGGGKGGKGGSLTNLSSPSGHLNRKKDLNSIEKKQITQHLIQNGYIDKKNLDAYKMYQSMGNTQLANDLQNYWIAYAANMPGKKGDAFRSILKNHYMYGETNTVSTPKPKAQPKAAPKKTASKPVGGGVSGGRSKNAYKNTKALGL